jgi:hypothetical protein
MKCEAKVLRSLPWRPPEDAVQSRQPLLPVPLCSKYRKFEVGGQPIFNIRRISWPNLNTDTFTLLLNPLLTTILIHAKA